MTMNNLQKTFIDNEIWILTFGGGFQRSNVYKKDVSDQERKKLRDYIKTNIINLVKPPIQNQESQP